MNQKEYYQKVYWDIERSPPTNKQIPVHAHRLRQIIANYISEVDILLDVGCGDGHYYGSFLSDLASVHIGADVSPRALKLAQKIGIQGLILDIERPLPLPTNSFGGAICIDVLEHLFSPQYLVQEIYRILKPGHYLIASVPNIAHYPHRIRLAGGKFVAGGLAATTNKPWRDPHIRFFTTQSLRNLMLEVGFSDVTVYGGYTAFLVRMPIVSITLRYLLGQPRLQKLSDAFEPLGYKWPSLFAGKIIAVARKA